MIGLKFRGMPPIRLAETVRDIAALKNEYAAAILDRSVYLNDDMVAAIMGQSLMTWEGRNPAPALDSYGNFQGTDLDLLSFLVPMADRGAVIDISHYRNRRKIVRRANEYKVGSNRFGPIIGLFSNKKALSFGVDMYDKTIIRRDPRIGREQVGRPSKYMLVDCDGHWYQGWDRISWDPTAEENHFLTEKDLWTDSTVIFKYYVHPSRWQSVFGAPYLLQKMLIERIDDEATFYRAEVKRLKFVGIKFGFDPRGSSYIPPGPVEFEGETLPIKVNTIEMTLDIPAFSGSYTPAGNDSRGLSHAHQRQKFLTQTLKPFVQFCVRANEAAYFHYGKSGIAHWMQDRKWVHGWKVPLGRVEWNMMRLSNAMALRYRIKSMTQRVSAE